MIYNAINNLAQSLEREGVLPRFGYEERGFTYCVVIDEQGKLVDIEECDKERTFIVPAMEMRSGNIMAFTGWDKHEYVFATGEGKRGGKCHDAFVEKQNKVFSGCKHPALTAFLKFLNDNDFEKLRKDERVVKALKNGMGFVHFFVVSQSQKIAIVELDEFKEMYEKHHKETLSDCETGECFVTGRENVPLVRTLDKIVTQFGRRSLVSFSYSMFRLNHNEGGASNFPVSHEAWHNVVSVFQYFMRNREHIVKMGDSVFVLFSEDGGDKVEQEIAWIARREEKDKAKDVKSEMESPRRGTETDRDIDRNNTFYIFEMSSGGTGNIDQGRVWVRDQIVKKTGEIIDNVKQYKKDMNWNDEFRPTIFDVCMSAEDKRNNYIRKSLIDELFVSALTGGRIPRELVEICLKRCEMFVVTSNADKAAAERDKIRTALIRAWLERENRRKGMKEKVEKGAAWHMGRMMAVADKIQRIVVQGNVARKISSSSISSLLNAPVAGYERMMNHVYRISLSSDRTTRCRELLAEIDADIEEAGMLPRRMNVKSRAEFFMGYHHQLNKQLVERKKYLEEKEREKKTHKNM